MTNEQMLLLRQQQVIAELQSQIQQITSIGGGNVARPQSSQLASQMMNQKRDLSLSDLSSQQVNGQLQQMGPNESFKEISMEKVKILALELLLETMQ